MKRAVVDQPGFKIIVLGLVVSLMIGLLIKGQISPKKLKFKIDQAILKLDPDVKVDFKSIEIKLSDWGWPQPYLEIHDVRLSPVQRICDESQIFIDTVSFPLTWNLIFESKKIIKSLRMNQLEIRLSEFKNCVSFNESKTAESALNSVLQQIFSAHNSGQLSDLKVDRIKVLSKSNFQTPLFLQAAVFNFTYADQMLSNLTLRAQLSSHLDDSKNIFKLKSDLNIHIFKKNKNEILIDGGVTGKIIDRNYVIKFNYDLLSNRFIFNANLDKISIKALIKFLNFENNSISLNLTTYFSNYFLTLDGSGYFDLNEENLTEFKSEHFLIESQDTFLKSKNMVIESLNPVRLGPNVEFQVSNYDLKTFFNENIKSDILFKNTAQFGKFSGQFKMLSNDRIQANGTISDYVLNLKYDNENWPHQINSGNVKYDFSNSRSDILITSMILNQQPIDGQINYSINSENHQKYQVDFGGKLLSSALLNHIFGQEQKYGFVLSFHNHKDHSQFEIRTDSVQWVNQGNSNSDSEQNKKIIDIFDEVFEKNKKYLTDAQLINKELKNIEMKIAESENLNFYEIDLIFRSKNYEIRKLFYDTNLQVFKLKKE